MRRTLERQKAKAVCKIGLGALSNWINGFENDSFEYDHPQGNYFAGYYAAKCMAALAVQGDSPLGDRWWNDWYNRQHLQRVAPYYTVNLDGGGWTEGFTQYGVLASRNQALPALAVKTAKGIDLIHAPQPYLFPLDQARYLMAFTWPTRNMMDDRGELYNTGDTAIWPGTPRLETYRFFAGFLAMWGDPMAPMMHKYARNMKIALDALHAGDSTEWVDFLFWDNTAPETSDYASLPVSHLAPGVGGVAARSDWSMGVRRVDDDHPSGECGNRHYGPPLDRHVDVEQDVADRDPRNGCAHGYAPLDDRFRSRTIARAGRLGHQC
ncbi:MAG: hypothetical protein HYX27_08565 [Acidobacteria bacterium]|nr:hypothetical protein [Acidobacteriota bacterium]